MKILNGKAVSKHLRENFKAEVAELSAAKGRPPGLAVVLVGDDPASQVYVSHKIKACAQVGVRSFEHRKPSELSAAELKKLIEQLNQDPQVDGILVQLPLPSHLHQEEVLSWVSPLKDADCLTAENLGLLWTGRARTKPCTPAGVMEILKYYDIDPSGMRAAVVGRSQIVGKPMSLMLLEADATVTTCHSRTKNLREILLQSDLVVAAAGKALLFGKEDFKKGAVVIDVGIHRGEEGLYGDVRFDELEGHAFAVTPVPGGVGPMTVTMLLANTIVLYKHHMS
jgi:methylenetetrahydrofolate dehydrogenase (NADP+)/methenyltetrahydrofolate cyclohydrolase